MQIAVHKQPMMMQQAGAGEGGAVGGTQEPSGVKGGVAMQSPFRVLQRACWESSALGISRVRGLVPVEHRWDMSDEWESLCMRRSERAWEYSYVGVSGGFCSVCRAVASWLR